MSKEFKPIHNEHGNRISERTASGKSLPEQLVECKEAYENLLEKYKRDVDNYKNENSKLLSEKDSYKSEVERLKAELEQIIKERDELKRELEDIKYREKLINELCNNVRNTVTSKKFDISREMAEIAVIVLKRLILSEYIPHEEIINRVLSEIFDRSIELYGNLNIYVSKEDIVRVEGSISLLKSRMPELNINLLVDESLKEGEVRVETSKYWIERKYDDIIEDIIEEVLNSERHISDIRKGS